MRSNGRKTFDSAENRPYLAPVRGGGRVGGALTPPQKNTRTIPTLKLTPPNPGGLVGTLVTF